ncbi:histidine kinase dimerization/phosphoacceptor domain -containing protein [Methylobacterium durans]|uniref:histidine kinase dimerization/phosphoacceptor domain -containing protein n=1 Tax=Methylobacterium durans TaxID=2202825 RepID=UPI002AFFA945|nr:histidine kinase dimerization/phosphoacceptor domain -containing protein [Methylobacterium durans]MEA1831398.1 histidine kinase dimerization/phosphoacceptor domain -containing protein [Methylobacterium durans]
MENADILRLADRTRAEFGEIDPFSVIIRTTQLPMIVTDPRRYDNPIVFANPAFLRMTGYERFEVTGRNCRFLQGPDTCPKAIARVREAIRAERPVEVDLLNYRKDGTTFYNALHLNPVHAKTGELQFYFAAQLDVTERYRLVREREMANAALHEALAVKTTLIHEIDHRVKNNLQMIAAMIVLQSQRIADPGTRASMMETLQRIEALNTVHRRLHQSESVSRFDVADFVRDLIGDLVGASGRDDIAVQLDLVAVVIPAEKSVALALLLNEIVTNILKHAFVGGRPGTLAVRIAREDEIRIVVQDDGVGMPEDGRTKGSFGQSLMRTLARQLGAGLAVERASGSGTRVVLTMPVAAPERVDDGLR